MAVQTQLVGGAVGPGAPVFMWQVHLSQPPNLKALETVESDLPSLVLQGAGSFRGAEYFRASFWDRSVGK